MSDRCHVCGDWIEEQDPAYCPDCARRLEAERDAARAEVGRLREIMAASLRVDCTAECRAEVGAKEGER